MLEIYFMLREKYLFFVLYQEEDCFTIDRDFSKLDHCYRLKNILAF